MREPEKTTLHRQKLPLDEEYWRNYKIADEYRICDITETDRKIFINKRLAGKAKIFEKYLITHGGKIKSIGEEDDQIIIEYSIPAQQK